MAETTELVARLRERAEYEDNGGVVEKQLFDTGALLREAADALERLSAPVEGMENHEPLSLNDELLVMLTQGRATGPCQADAASWIESLYRDITRLQAEVARLKTDLAAATAAREAAEARVVALEAGLKPFLRDVPLGLESADTIGITVLVDDLREASALLPKNGDTNV